MKYMGQNFKILYHGTDAICIPGIVETGKLMPAMERVKQQTTEDSHFRRLGFDEIQKLLEAPDFLQKHHNSKRTLKQLLTDNQVKITRENYEALRDKLMQMEVQEVMDSTFTDEQDRERYGHVWFTFDTGIARTYGKAAVLGMKIPKSIEKQAYFRYPGQIGFPCSISLDNLREVCYKNDNPKWIERLKESFGKWNPKFVDLGERK